MNPADMPPLSNAAALTGGHIEYSPQEANRFIQDLRRSKREVEVARRQFDTVTDPLLIDHIVFRLSAAEQQFNYLIQLAKKLDIIHDGMSWLWYEEED